MHIDVCKNINKLYKFTVKCDDQQQYKAILGAAIISIPEVFTETNPISPGLYATVKILMQGNHSLNFLTYWIFKKKLSFAG